MILVSSHAHRLWNDGPRLREREAPISSKSSKHWLLALLGLPSRAFHDDFLGAAFPTCSRELRGCNVNAFP